MKVLANSANVSCNTRVKALTSGASKTITKIVMETQDLVNNRMTLSVLIDRDIVKLSPAELLSTPYIVNHLSKAEVERVAYLMGEHDAEAALRAQRKTSTKAITARAPITKIVVEDQNLITDQMQFTVLFNRDLVKLNPMALLGRMDILSHLSQQDVKRAMYLAGVEYEILKTKAEGLIA